MRFLLVMMRNPLVNRLFDLPPTKREPLGLTVRFLRVTMRFLLVTMRNLILSIKFWILLALK